MQNRMRRLLGALAGDELGTVSEEGVWHPPVNVYNRPDSLVVEVDLPGMKGQDVEVSIEENHLYIEGSRAPSEQFAEEALYYTERPTGRFHRIVHLPENVDADGTEAHYEDGVLNVVMPKSTREGGRRIEIS